MILETTTGAFPPKTSGRSSVIFKKFRTARLNHPTGDTKKFWRATKSSRRRTRMSLRPTSQTGIYGCSEEHDAETRGHGDAVKKSILAQPDSFSPRRLGPRVSASLHSHLRRKRFS